MKYLLLALLLAGCAHDKWKPYQPRYYEQGDRISAMCFDGVLEASPPTCADIGWCAQYGYTVVPIKEEWDECVVGE